MARPLGSALADRPLFFEPTPPSARSSPAHVAEELERIAELLRHQPRIDLVDVPELVDENHSGHPYYRSGDVRRFGAALGEATRVPVAVNKVVAHLASGDALEEWAHETIGGGIHHAILVGGSSHFLPYPGPNVLEANRRARPHFQAVGGHLGNIAIPQRRGEAERLLSKTAAGASFFTTQILFDSSQAIELARAYAVRCRSEGLAPAALVLSFAPLIDEQDAAFIRWLGADLPEAAEHEILGGESAESATSRSVDRAVRVWEETVAALEHSRDPVPLGVNVEQIRPRHLEPATSMLRAFAGRIDGASHRVARRAATTPRP